MQHEDLSKLSLVALRNLLLLELREFIAALDTESSEQLQHRKERIRQIDEEIDKRKKTDKYSGASYYPQP